MAPTSPKRRGHPPSQAGPSASSSGASSNPRDEPNENQNAGGAEADAPQFEWVYNSDHTDPVNFGYMFLKPVGTRPTRANAGPSQIPVSLPSPSVAPQLSHERSFPTPFTSSRVSSEGFTQPSQPINTGRSFSRADPVGHPSASKDGGKQHPVTPQPLRSPSESSSQGSVHHKVPYRSSPHFGTSANPPPEQLTPPDSLQWSVREPVSLYFPALTIFQGATIPALDISKVPSTPSPNLTRSRRSFDKCSPNSRTRFVRKPTTAGVEGQAQVERFTCHTSCPKPL